MTKKKAANGCGTIRLRSDGRYEGIYSVGNDPGTGKLIRKIFSSSTHVTIRSMVEMYIVDRDYLTKDEAKEQSRIKPSDVKFVIPSSVPPLNEATRKMVEMANAAKNK